MNIYFMMAVGEMEVKVHTLWILALDGFGR
jgi:hypothetical protein